MLPFISNRLPLFNLSTKILARAIPMLRAQDREA
jgi:hypothetical protein